MHTRTNLVMRAVLVPAALTLGACGDAAEPTSPNVRPHASSTMEEPLAGTIENVWATMAPMPTARSGMVAAAVDDIIYVVGGIGSDISLNTLPIAEAFDTRANRWTTVQPMPENRALPSGAAVIGGKIYVPGGLFGVLPTNSLFVFDPPTNTWSRKAPLSVATTQGLSAAIAGKLYVLTPPYVFGEVQPRLHRYDPNTNSWTERATPPNSHLGGVAGVIGGKLYVAAGAGSSGPTNRLDVYDPATDTWDSRTPIPTVRQYAGGAVVNGKLYVAGGLGAGLVKLRALEVYDPKSDSWSTGTDMPTARAFFAAAASGGNLFAIGGETNGEDNPLVHATEAYISSRSRGQP